MGKKYLLSACCLLAGIAAGAQQTFSVHLQGQPRCGFEQILQRSRISYAALLQAYKATDNGAAMTKTTAVVYDIPVVFHIVSGAQTPSFNIADSIIINQVSVLNSAFRNNHQDTADTRAMFKPLAADAEIQFHLAAVDPLGNPTTGITRTQSARYYFGSADGSLDSLERMKHTATGGHDAWPTDKYLNIWVGNMTDSSGQLSVLGYGVPPLNPLPNTWPAGSEAELASLQDGVMLQVHCVGANNALSAQINGIYTMGRAAVHEVGHYLGLQHIFGSNGGGTAQCGAIADDGMADTPEQSELSFDNNSGVSCPPATKNSCGAGTAGDMPDLWEDYMDYARDACQTLFTHDQVALMRLVMGNQRSAMVLPTAISNIPARTTLALYPNPAAQMVYTTLPGQVSQVTVRNMLGQNVMMLSGAAATCKAYDVSSLAAGQYAVELMSSDNRRYVARLVIAH